MYLPAHFEEARIDQVHRLMREHPLGALVTNGPDGLDANHIPFEFDASGGEHGMLRAHVARANPICATVYNGTGVLVIFKGADAYISPNWYPSKHEFHNKVPTWNYQVVHAHGRLKIRDDEPYVRALVARLTRAHEANQPVPWKISDSPKEIVDTLLAAIVGIEITVTRLVGKSKLGQNQGSRDRHGAAAALAANGNASLAREMLEAPPRDVGAGGT
jgi:transcriptional regulator